MMIFEPGKMGYADAFMQRCLQFYAWEDKNGQRGAMIHGSLSLNFMLGKLLMTRSSNVSCIQLVL